MTPTGRSGILFVCTGNTCRSPLAEVLARQRFGELDVSLPVASAGVSAIDGAEASVGAQAAAAEVGLDLSKHRARLLTRTLLLESELVLAMSESHVRLARILVPEAADRVHLLADYAGVGAAEVPDPYGRDVSQYRQTLNLLRPWIARSLDRFVEGATSPER